MPKMFRSLLVSLLSLLVLSVAVAWQTTPTKSEAPDQILPVLREAKPRYWKGNLHTHSLWSDGDDFPEMIADWYRRHDYHFLALSEHNVLAEGERWLEVTKTREPALQKYLARFGPTWVEQRTQEDKKQVLLKPFAEYRSLLDEPGRFLLIPSEEITHRFAKNPVHMNAINLRDVVKPIDGKDVSETIRVNMRAVEEQRKKVKQRMLVFLNHPNYIWGVRAEDMALAEEMRYFEVFNGHPGVKNYGDETHPSCEKLWDIVLALRLGKLKLPIIYGLATDDAHGYHQFGVGKVNPGRGWVMVQSPYLSAEAMVRGLEAGDFYASSGVVLKEIRKTGTTYALTIEGEKDVTYKTEFIGTLKDVPLDSEARADKEGKPITGQYHEGVGKVLASSDKLTASYTLTGKELYVRARITSSKPHPNPYQKDDVEMAWTQPVLP